MNFKQIALAIWETLKTLVVIIVLAMLIRTYLIQPFIVDGASMEPTYHNNDYLLIDKLSLRNREPRRGEVIVFKYPRDPRENYIKRVVGLPGDTVTVKDDTITIKNAAHPDGVIAQEPYIRQDSLQSPYPGEMTVTLEPNQYFVLGDNRHASSDSRFFGALNRSYIVGRPVLRLFPFNNISVVAAATDPLPAE